MMRGEVVWYCDLNSVVKLKYKSELRKKPFDLYICLVTKTFNWQKNDATELQYPLVWLVYQALNELDCAYSSTVTEGFNPSARR